MKKSEKVKKGAILELILEHFGWSLGSIFNFRGSQNPTFRATAIAGYLQMRYGAAQGREPANGENHPDTLWRVAPRIRSGSKLPAANSRSGSTEGQGASGNLLAWEVRAVMCGFSENSGRKKFDDEKDPPLRNHISLNSNFVKQSRK